MSKKLIELENGLKMEVEASQNEIKKISSGKDMVQKVNNSMETVENILLQSMKPIINTYKELNQNVTIEKAEVEIGIGFSAEGNVFVAKGSASANLKIKLILSPVK